MDDDRTPMLRQYQTIKAQHPDAILMFRLGDFYEMFYDDAQVASRTLSLTLTSRGRGTRNEAPMCGVPYHAADAYIARLIREGFRVAICDQIEDARNAKGIVRRAVTRVLSPGTVTDEQQLQARSPNYIAALFWGGDPGEGEVRGGIGAAFLDLSTGDFRLSEHRGPRARETLAAQVALFSPSEIVHAEGRPPAALLSAGLMEKILSSAAPAWAFASETAGKALLARLGTASLQGFGCEGADLAVAAAGGLLFYLQETQKADLRHLTRVTLLQEGDAMTLDATTRRTLELTENARDGGRDGTLLEILDRTGTSMGGRMLRDWLLRPLLDVAAIEERLDAVEFFVAHPGERTKLRGALSRIGDLERLLARAALGTATPRDLAGLRESLAVLPAIAHRFVWDGREEIGDLPVGRRQVRMNEAVERCVPFGARERRGVPRRQGEEAVHREIARGEGVEQAIERLVGPAALDQLETVREQHRTREQQAQQVELVAVNGQRRGGLAPSEGEAAHPAMLSRRIQLSSPAIEGPGAARAFSPLFGGEQPGTGPAIADVRAPFGIGDLHRPHNVSTFGSNLGAAIPIVRPRQVACRTRPTVHSQSGCFRSAVHFITPPVPGRAGILRSCLIRLA